MDLRRLSHLVTLADELHFARAAQRAHLSQSAFSRSIQVLEDELGVRLFDREPGEVRVTVAGEFVIERARRLLFEARCLQRDVDLYRDSELGAISFGVAPVATAYLMPQVLVELRRDYPGVDVRVEQSDRMQLMERLQAESIEFFVAAVGDLPESTAVSVDVRMLPSHPARCFVRHGHPLSGRACGLAEAWRCGVASVGLTEKASRQLSKVLRLPTDQRCTLALQSDDFALLKAVTMQTDTILISTPPVVHVDVDTGTLVPLEIVDFPVMNVRFGIVTLRRRTPSPLAKRAMECVQRAAREFISTH